MTARSRPGSRGRIQDLWETGVGAWGYGALLGVADWVEPRLPDLPGTGLVRDFYRVDRRLALTGGETVLDLACGPGTLTRRLADAVGDAGLVVGVDLSEAMLARATRGVRASNVALMRADATDLPLRADTVDAVCCSLCLHLVPDLETALTGIARVLRPGGPIAIAVPAHAPGPLRVFSEALSRWGQARLFDRGELSAALEGHGFVRLRERIGQGLSLVDAVAPG